MGFMDRFKGAAEQTQQAAKSAACEENVGDEITLNVEPDDPNSMLHWG
jgi:hypothetical protein